MTLRIFQDAGEEGAALALHGWLSAAEAPELERLAAAQRAPLTIDLAHLVGADADGLGVLLRLRGCGARLTGASPFIELMLERMAAQETVGPRR